MTLSRLFFKFSKTINFDGRKNIFTTAPNRLKEIIERKEGNHIIVEGRIVPDPRESMFIKPRENGACILCSAGVDVKHTDVLILQQFVTSTGKTLPRRITGLCNVQQKRIGIMIGMAQKAGLLRTKNCKKDPRKRVSFKGLNTYYDEDTIKQRYY